MITVIAGLVAILAIYKVRKMLCRPHNLFIDDQPRISRKIVMSNLKNMGMQDATVEREISEWLYPKER